MTGSAYPVTQFDLTPFLVGSSLLLVVGISALAYILIGKSEEYKDLKASFDKIMRSFNELDEQAKLIVKTDLELNKAQEELDRRLTGLNSLQKLARTMSMTMDEQEIFQKINKDVATDMGFSRMIVLTCDPQMDFTLRVNIGTEPAKTQKALAELMQDPQFLAALKNGTTFSSLSSSQQTRTRIIELFETEHFILSPLMTQRGVAGILFVGNRYSAPAITEGDQELIAILASQLAQSLENSQLFEQVYRSSQMLETKVNERTKELSQVLKDVEDISKKKTEFISAVSHELRTPLTSIKGYASILMTGKVGDIPDAVKERLGKINSHSDNLVKLINDLLDISRIESGRVEMKVAPQNIKLLLENTADLLTPQLKDKGVTIKLNVPADMPLIEYDPTQVDRVFINLISNAIKFTPAGGSITINAAPNLGLGESTFEVADTGIGIKKEDLARIFDEFFRVDNDINMKVKGTGLGLALAKNIVEAHFGRMWVTSEVGHGTTFHFTLPFTHKTPEDKKLKIGDA
ncbi:MAG: GAF domain-containing sensor histidine kinase [Candidatus Omnitrophica bacterium]|nr:GAF domain-containing sensor histidine kinase [Candidatus Omnitrophota bacterium]